MSQKDELDTLFFGSSMDESQQERGDDEISQFNVVYEDEKSNILG